MSRLQIVENPFFNALGAKLTFSTNTYGPLYFSDSCNLSHCDSKLCSKGPNGHPMYKGAIRHLGFYYRAYIC